MIRHARSSVVAGLAAAALATVLTAGTAAAQSYAPPAGWSGYQPGAAWGVAPTPAPAVAYVYPDTSATADPYAAWNGYNPAASWIGYQPARAWVGYAPVTAYVAPEQPRYPGIGTVRAPIFNYRELGTGRQVPAFKPWLPGGAP